MAQGQEQLFGLLGRHVSGLCYRYHLNVIMHVNGAPASQSVMNYASVISQSGVQDLQSNVGYKTTSTQ